MNLCEPLRYLLQLTFLSLVTIFFTVFFLSGYIFVSWTGSLNVHNVHNVHGTGRGVRGVFWRDFAAPLP